MSVYKQFADLYKGWDKKRIRDEAVHLAIVVSKGCNILAKDSFYPFFFHASAIKMFFSDNPINQDELELYSDLISALPETDYETPNATLNDVSREFYSNTDNLYEDVAPLIYKCCTNLDKVMQEPKITTCEIFLRFLTLCAIVDGEINDMEIAEIERAADASQFTSSNANTDSSSADIEKVDNDVEAPLDDAESPEPTIQKFGATLYRDDDDYYFSVGAEILLPGKDGEITVIIQLMDKDGFVLESLKETFYAEHGIIHYGNEYNLNCVPSSYKISVKALARGELEWPASTSAKVTGMRFLQVHSHTELAAMCENLTNEYQYINVYTTFYDEDDNIIGGAKMEGAGYSSRFFPNTPDRVEARIYCESVIDRTAMFRWTCSILS